MGGFGVGSIYHLGSSSDEQERLTKQRVLYGDTEGIVFEPTDTVCEVGCGSGVNLWIARQLTQGRYIGVDNQEAHVRAGESQAQKLGLHNAEFIHADGAELPLDDDSCDVAFCRFVLIHQPDPMKILSQMYRVTKQGGRVLTIEPSVRGYYFGPDKPNLVRCFEERSRFVYGGGKGSLDASFDVYSCMTKLGLKERTLRSHLVLVHGSDRERCAFLLKNALGLIAPVARQLIDADLITKDQWQRAQHEASVINDDTIVHQSMIIAEGRKR